MKLPACAVDSVHTWPGGDGLFSDATLRAKYARHRSCPVTGPSANGDGDLIAWMRKATLLLLSDFRQADEGAPFPRQESQPPAKDPPEPPQLLEDFRWFAMLVFYAAYGEERLVPHQAWIERYALLELDLRILWGGRRVRIPKRPKRGDTEPLVRAALKSGARIADIPGAIGVSRATVYRILNRRN